MKKFWRRAVSEDKDVYEGLRVLPSADSFSSWCQKISGFSAAFLAAQSGGKLIPRSVPQVQKANHEDKGAGEGLTSCIYGVQERGLSSGGCENFDSDEMRGVSL